MQPKNMLNWLKILFIHVLEFMKIEARLPTETRPNIENNTLPYINSMLR